MSVPFRHIWQQTPVIGAMARTAASLVLPSGKGEVPETPTAWNERVIHPISPSLMHDYMSWLGGSWDQQHVPPHLFCHFAFPDFSRLLAGLPYRLDKLLNGGASLTTWKPLPADQPFTLQTRLSDIDATDRRVILTETCRARTADGELAFEGTLTAILPLKRGGGGVKKERPKPPTDADKLADWPLDARAGLDFALLTGDFNPIHWLPPFAKMGGMKNVILHGFAQFARTWEALSLGAGVQPATLQARFVKPLVLPRQVGVFATDSEAWIADGPGSLAFMHATFHRGTETQNG